MARENERERRTRARQTEEKREREAKETRREKERKSKEQGGGVDEVAYHLKEEYNSSTSKTDEG